MSSQEILGARSEADFIALVKQAMIETPRRKLKTISSKAYDALKEVTIAYGKDPKDALSLYNQKEREFAVANAQLRERVEFPLVWDDTKRRLGEKSLKVEAADITGELVLKRGRLEFLPVEEYHPRAMLMFKEIPGTNNILTEAIMTKLKRQMGRRYYMNASLLQFLLVPDWEPTATQTQIKLPMIQPFLAPQEQPAQPQAMQPLELVAARSNHAGGQLVANDPSAFHDRALVMRGPNPIEMQAIVAIAATHGASFTINYNNIDNSNSNNNNNNNNQVASDSIVVEKLDSLKQDIRDVGRQAGETNRTINNVDTQLRTMSAMKPPRTELPVQLAKLDEVRRRNLFDSVGDGQRVAEPLGHSGSFTSDEKEEDKDEFFNPVGGVDYPRSPTKYENYSTMRSGEEEEGGVAPTAKRTVETKNKDKPAADTKTSPSAISTSAAIDSRIADAKDDDEEKTKEEGTGTFKPVINLDEFETLCTYRSELFLQGESDGRRSWNKCGIGNACILHHQEHGHFRFLMRQEKTMEVIANCALKPEIKLVPNAGNDRSWTLIGYDDAEVTMKRKTFSLRFKDSKVAKEFKGTYEECQRKIQLNNIFSLEEGMKIERTVQSEQSKKDDKSNRARYDEPDVYTAKVQGTPAVMSSLAGSEFTSAASITTLSGSRGDLFKSEPGEWKCTVCTLKNPKVKSECLACEAPKEHGKDSSGDDTSINIGSAPTPKAASGAIGSSGFLFRDKLEEFSTPVGEDPVVHDHASYGEAEGGSIDEADQADEESDQVLNDAAASWWKSPF